MRNIYYYLIDINIVNSAIQSYRNKYIEFTLKIFKKITIKNKRSVIDLSSDFSKKKQRGDTQNSIGNLFAFSKCS